MLPLLSRPSSPGWPSASRRYCLLERNLFLCWWFLLQLVLLLQYHKWAWMVFLRLGFWLWFCRPTRHLVTLLAKHPLPPLSELWWSSAMFDSSLPSDHWLVGVLVKKTSSWFRVLNKSSWILGCRTNDHYLIWSSLVCWTCKLYFST